MALLFRYTIEFHGELTEVEAKRLDEQLFLGDLRGALREVVEEKVAETSFTGHSEYDITVRVLP
jgi:hypothetical protein